MHDVVAAGLQSGQIQDTIDALGLNDVSCCDGPSAGQTVSGSVGEMSTLKEALLEIAGPDLFWGLACPGDQHGSQQGASTPPNRHRFPLRPNRHRFPLLPVRAACPASPRTCLSTLPRRLPR
jgi:hypothetical protein